METQICSFYQTAQMLNYVNIFGYSSRAMPSLEIIGVGSISKSIKEKLIYLTRKRNLKVPNRKFVICVDLNSDRIGRIENLKWLEFPILLCFWHLCGLIPIRKLDDCITSGQVNSFGKVMHLPLPSTLNLRDATEVSPIKNLKYISCENTPAALARINSELLLEHIPELSFDMAYMDSFSVTPSKGSIT